MPGTETPSCDLCNKAFTRRCDVYKHLRKVHKQEPASLPRNFKCKWPGCTERFYRQKALNQHLSSVHGAEIRCVEVSFPTFSAFLQWLSDLELASNSSFVNYKTKDSGDGKKKLRYYRCNRSGAIKASNALTRGESRRMGENCSSKIDVVEWVGGDNKGHVSVNAYIDHHGHAPEIDKIHLPHNFKSQMITKLHEDAPVDSIHSPNDWMKRPAKENLPADVRKVVDLKPQFKDPVSGELGGGTDYEEIQTQPSRLARLTKRQERVVKRLNRHRASMDPSFDLQQDPDLQLEPSRLWTSFQETSRFIASVKYTEEDPELERLARMQAEIAEALKKRGRRKALRKPKAAVQPRRQPKKKKKALSSFTQDSS